MLAAPDPKVAKGNEKGDVKNPAKRSERTYLTPIPAIGTLAELGPMLLQQCEKDLDREGAVALYYSTFDDPEDGEPCRPSIDAVLDAVWRRQEP